MELTHTEGYGPIGATLSHLFDRSHDIIHCHVKDELLVDREALKREIEQSLREDLP